MTPLPSHVTRSLAVILLLGAALRIGACVAVSPTQLMNDEVLYHKLPARIAAGEPLGDAGGRTPGVIVLHAALYRAFGADTDVARGGNVVLGVASLVLVFLLGRRMAGDRAGLVATALAAGYPVFVAYSHYLLSETLYLFLMLGTLVALTWGERPPTLARAGLARAALAGVLAGLCALTREVGLTVVVVAAAWLVWTAVPRPRAGLTLSAALALGALVVIVPWSVHLNRHSDRLVLVSRTTWLNLYLGNHEGAHFLRYHAFGDDRGERELAARELAVAAIAERLPAWPFEKTVRNVPQLLKPTAFPVRRLLQRPEREEASHGQLGSWAYRFRWRALDRDATRRSLALTVPLAYLVVLLAGAAGLALAPDRRLATLVAALALAHVAPVVVTFANTRFRLPLMPLLIVGAAALAVAPALRWREASRGQRVLAIGTLGLLLLCLAAERDAWLSPTQF